jgi:hypothetical protein
MVLYLIAMLLIFFVAFRVIARPSNGRKPK